jgi:hypothetical protein
VLPEADLALEASVRRRGGDPGPRILHRRDEPLTRRELVRSVGELRRIGELGEVLVERHAEDLVLGHLFGLLGVRGLASGAEGDHRHGGRQQHRDSLFA